MQESSIRMNTTKAKLPTRYRMSFIQGFPHYSPRLVFTLGLIQTVCGFAIIILSAAMYHCDKKKTWSWSVVLTALTNYLHETFRFTWLGSWILSSGLAILIMSCRPYNRFQTYTLLVTSLVSLVVTGSFAILITNSVIQQSIIPSMTIKDPYQNIMESSGENVFPVNLGVDEELNDSRCHLILNVFMLCFCAVAFVISIVCFSMISHLLCTCSMFPGTVTTDYHIYDASIWSRKERIIQWVIQQSQLTTTTHTTTSANSKLNSIVLDNASLHLSEDSCIKHQSTLQSCTHSTAQLSLHAS